MPIRRTGDPNVDRAFNDSEASRLRDEKGLLSKGIFGTPVVYALAAVVLKPGQAALVWRGRSAATATLPPAAGLKTGAAEWVVIHNEGASTLTVKPNAKETISDGFLASSSIALRPGQSLLLVSDGASRWASAPASSLGWAVDSFSASAALARSNQAVVWTGAAGTLTLPAANVDGAGVSHFVYVFNNGTGVLTVAAAGTDTIADGLADQASIALASRTRRRCCGATAPRSGPRSLPAAPIGSAEHDYERGQSATSGTETWYYCNSPQLHGPHRRRAHHRQPLRDAVHRAEARIGRAGAARPHRRAHHGRRRREQRPPGALRERGDLREPLPGRAHPRQRQRRQRGSAVVTDTPSQALTAGALYWCVVHPSAAISIACLGSAAFPTCSAPTTRSA
jgi:hypothetical protein